MIIDTLRHADRYLAGHPLFAKAFEYIQSTDLEQLTDGKHEIIPGQLLAIVTDKPGVSAEEGSKKFECHNRNIDIQLCIRGREKFGWRPRESCTLPREAFNEEKDVQFFNDTPDMFFELGPGQFAVFFPSDVHAPMIGEGLIKKVVIKVKI